MEVKPGYQQTEVGVIPEEWEVKPLKRLSPSQSVGLVINPSTYFDKAGTVPLLVGSNVSENAIDSSTSNRITKESNDKLPASRLSAGDLVMVRVGEPGVTAVVPPELDGCNCASMMIVRQHPSFDSHWLCCMMNSRHGRQQVEHVQYGTAQKQFNISDAVDFLYPVPPLPEQRAIAAALSDVDGLLGGLDRLIAKKRDLKQAAMQQLLTGQTRLPGFHGEWEVKRLKQVAKISTGINKPLSEMGSGALYVTVQDLYDKTSIRTERLSRIKVSPSEIETRGLMVGDIVFGKSSVKRDGIGYPSQFLGCDEPVVFSGFTYRARAWQGITDATFLFYALREEKTRRWLIDNSQASALTNINQTIADAIPVQVPPSIPEQTAIAAVLSEMDGELAVLEQRREKTRALKQAMMQELLTGRTRLV
jgi:type I restriction enzyme S subunit